MQAANQAPSQVASPVVCFLCTCLLDTIHSPAFRPTKQLLFSHTIDSMFRGCIQTASRQVGRAIASRLAVSSTVVPSFGSMSRNVCNVQSLQRALHGNRRDVCPASLFHPSAQSAPGRSQLRRIILQDYGEAKQEEPPKESDNDMDPEEFEAFMNEESKKSVWVAVLCDRRRKGKWRGRNRSRRR